MRLRNGLWACLAILILGNLTGLLAIGPAAHAQSVQSSPVSAEVTEALARMNKTLQAEKFSFRSNASRIRIPEFALSLTVRASILMALNSR